MKGILLATLVSSVYATCVLLVFRTTQPRFRARAMIRMFLASVPVLVFAFLATPADLGVLPSWLVEDQILLELAFCVFIYSASVLGGWLQLYNLADRGLSLRILIDALENSTHPVTADGVRATYGAGKGIDWMYRKRLDDLQRLELVTADAGSLRLTDRGQRNARLVACLRRVFHLHQDRQRHRC